MLFHTEIQCNDKRREQTNKETWETANSVEPENYQKVIWKTTNHCPPSQEYLDMLVGILDFSL